MNLLQIVARQIAWSPRIGHTAKDHCPRGSNPESMRYRLNEPIVAMQRGRSNAESAQIALPPGAILQLPSDVPLRGLIDADWNGERIQVFAEDVRSRGTTVETTGMD